MQTGKAERTYLIRKVSTPRGKSRDSKGTLKKKRPLPTQQTNPASGFDQWELPLNRKRALRGRRGGKSGHRAKRGLPPGGRRPSDIPFKTLPERNKGNQRLSRREGGTHFYEKEVGATGGVIGGGRHRKFLIFTSRCGRWTGERLEGESSRSSKSKDGEERQGKKK